MMDFDQTQAIDFDEYDDETDEDSPNDKGKVLARLKVPRQKGVAEKIYALYQGRNVIGRNEDSCDICIPIKSLSKQHACIEIRGESHLIYDLKSRNKTRRGKLFLSPDVRYELKNDDALVFGDVKTYYHKEIEKADSGSETESEEDFQTAPLDSVHGKNSSLASEKKTALQETVLYEDDVDDEDSNASSNILDTTQNFVPDTPAMKDDGSQLLTRCFATVGDNESKGLKITNVTVSDTPTGLSKPKPFVDASESMILPESQMVEERQPGIQTLIYDEDDEDIEKVDKRLLCAATQAYGMDIVDDTESETEDEEKAMPAIFAAATQAYGASHEVSESEEEDDEKDATFCEATQAYATGSDTEETKPIEPAVAYQMDTKVDRKRKSSPKSKVKSSKGKNVTTDPTQPYVMDVKTSKDTGERTGMEATQINDTDSEDDESILLKKSVNSTDKKSSPKSKIKPSKGKKVTTDPTQPYIMDVKTSKNTGERTGMEATQINDTDSEDDESILPKMLVTSTDKELVLPETQTYSEEEDEPEEADVSRLFAAPTLACDMVDEVEMQSDTESETQENYNTETQVVTEDATQVFDGGFDVKQTSKGKKLSKTCQPETVATQEITSDSDTEMKTSEKKKVIDSEEIQTQICTEIEATVKVGNDTEESEAGTQEFIAQVSTLAEDNYERVSMKDVNISDSATQVLDDQTLDVSLNTKSVGSKKQNIKHHIDETVDGTQVMDSADETVPVSDSGGAEPTLQLNAVDQKLNEADATQVLEMPDETVDISEIKPSKSEKASKTRKNVKANEIESTQTFDDDTSTRRTKSTRGRKSKQKTVDATQVIESPDETVAIEDDTLPVSSKKSKNVENLHTNDDSMATQVFDDDEASESGILKSPKGRRFKQENIDATQVIETPDETVAIDAFEHSSDHKKLTNTRKSNRTKECEATQVFGEDATPESSEIKPSRGRKSQQQKTETLPISELPDETIPIEEVDLSLKSKPHGSTRRSRNVKEGDATQVLDENIVPKGEKGKPRARKSKQHRIESPHVAEIPDETVPIEEIELSPKSNTKTTKDNKMYECEATQVLDDDVLPESNKVNTSKGKQLKTKPTPTVAMPDETVPIDEIEPLAKSNKKNTRKSNDVDGCEATQVLEENELPENADVKPQKGRRSRHQKMAPAKEAEEFAATQILDDVLSESTHAKPSRGRKSWQEKRPVQEAEETPTKVSAGKSTRSKKSGQLDKEATQVIHTPDDKVPIDNLHLDIHDSEKDGKIPDKRKSVRASRSRNSIVSESVTVKDTEIVPKRGTKRKSRFESGEDVCRSKVEKPMSIIPPSLLPDSETPPLDDSEIVPDSEESDPIISPVIPATSPLKSALVDRKRSPSPSPKKVAFSPEVKDNEKVSPSSKKKLNVRQKTMDMFVKRTSNEMNVSGISVGARISRCTKSSDDGKETDADTLNSKPSKRDKGKKSEVPSNDADTSEVKKPVRKGRRKANENHDENASSVTKSIELPAEKDHEEQSVVEECLPSRRGRKGKLAVDNPKELDTNEDGKLSAANDKSKILDLKTPLRNKKSESSTEITSVAKVSERRSRRGKNDQKESKSLLSDSAETSSKRDKISDTISDLKTKQKPNSVTDPEIINTEKISHKKGKTGKSSVTEEENTSVPPSDGTAESVRGKTMNSKRLDNISDAARKDNVEHVETTSKRGRRSVRSTVVVKQEVCDDSFSSSDTNHSTKQPSHKITDSVNTSSVASIKVEDPPSSNKTVRGRGRSKKKIDVNNHEDDHQENTGDVTLSSRCDGKEKEDEVKKEEEDMPPPGPPKQRVSRSKLKQGTDEPVTSTGRSRKIKEELESVTPSTSRRSRSKQGVRAQADAENNSSSESEEVSLSKENKKRKTSDDSDTNDIVTTPAKKSRTKPAETPSKATKVNLEAISSPSLRRKSVDPKPKVIFTGLVDEQGQKTSKKVYSVKRVKLIKLMIKPKYTANTAVEAVKDLGGELVDNVMNCTHLVTDKVRRTVKFLCCLSKGLPIVTPEWLTESRKSKKFVDTHPFLVHDEASEKQYRFCLKRSLEKATEERLMSNLKIHVTKSVKPEPSQMKDILQCAGAQFLVTMPKKFEDNSLVISCDTDKTACQSALNNDIPVVSAEFVLTGILRQELDQKSYRLFTEKGSKRQSCENTKQPKKKK